MLGVPTLSLFGSALLRHAAPAHKRLHVERCLLALALHLACLAFPPRQGGALLYDSRLDLLHYAAPVHAGHEKWILQLLIDHRLPPGHEHMPLVDWDTGAIIPG